MAAGGHPRHALAGPEEAIPVRAARDAREMQERRRERPGTRENKKR
jgi:hypothetical protein